MSIKLNKAVREAQMLPKATTEILASMPQTLLDSLTSKQIVMVMQALNAHWHKARQFERNEIRSEGGMWDDTALKFRELQ